VRAAIDLLAGLEGERLLVLGDMGEVGERGPEFHREVGGYARERGVDGLFALGAMSLEAVTAFGERGWHFDDVDALLRALRPRLGPSVAVLVKGSRFMRMERVVQAIASAQPEGVH
jgi:UDP-N-acetylmuramoyl-tripeptide--D-alanyl-D-alanine ligase